MSTIKRALLIASMLAFPLTSSAYTRKLFNGRDLTGWKYVGSGRFVVEDGLLHPEGGVGLLWFNRMNKRGRFYFICLQIIYLRRTKNRTNRNAPFYSTNRTKGLYFSQVRIHSIPLPTLLSFNFQ
jgi:hypothetical protein